MLDYENKKEPNHFRLALNIKLKHEKVVINLIY
jgi:hypothetical protein